MERVLVSLSRRLAGPSFQVQLVGQAVVPTDSLRPQLVRLLSPAVKSILTNIIKRTVSEKKHTKKTD